MKKKLILTTIMIAVLIVSSSFTVFADTSNDSEIKSSDAVINSVDNPTIEICFLQPESVTKCKAKV